MRTYRSPSRLWWYVSVLLLLALSAACVSREAEPEEGNKGKRRSGQVLAEVVQSPAGQPVESPALAASGFTPQTRLGYTSGDQWEPAIAADRFGHVYVLYPQYLGVPGCSDCPSPTVTA